LGEEFGGRSYVGAGRIGNSRQIFSLRQAHQNGHELCPEDVAQALCVMPGGPSPNLYTHLRSGGIIILDDAVGRRGGVNPFRIDVDGFGRIYP